MEARKVIGTLLLIGGSQFLLLLTVSETQYDGYSTSLNYISDLGVWNQPSAYIFNPSVAFLGIMTLTAGCLIFSRLGWHSQGVLIGISGLGAIGVGIFNELTGAPHILFALMAFAGGAVAGIILKRMLQGIMGYFSLAFGIISLLALFLLGAGIWLGLGPGGMERMIMYPQVAFSTSLGGYFLAGQSAKK